MKNSNPRVWLSPLTLLTFLVIGITGLLMLFHVRLPAVKVLHEVIGVGFVVIGTIHVVINWRAFMGYFRQRAARLSLGVGLLVCAALLVLGINHPDEESHGRHGSPAMRGQDVR